MLPSLAHLSLHGGGLKTNAGKAPKPEKDPGAKKTPYFKKSNDWDSSPEQRTYIQQHWQDDTWKLDLEPPETPSPPPNRKFWNRVPLKPGQNGYDETEVSELKRAKKTAAKMHPVLPVTSSEPKNVAPELEFVPTAFVPKPYVPPPPPPDPSLLVMPVDFEKLKSLTGELSFDEVKTRMAAIDPAWASKSTKNADTMDMKVKIRKERLQKLVDGYQALLAASYTTHEEAQKKAEEVHEIENQKAKDQFEQKQALVLAPGGNMILNSEATRKQLIFALLRINFQKKGTNNSMRFWSTKKPSGKVQDPPVSKALNDARKKWATEQIDALGDGDRLAFLLSIPYNPPPLELFLSVDTPPTVPQSDVNDPLGMPEYAGTITGVASSEYSDGAKIFFYVKAVEKAFTEGTISSLPPLGADFSVTDDGARAAATKALTTEFTPFLTQLVEWGVDQQQLFGENNVKDYTAGSGRFNRTLRVKPQYIQEFFWGPLQTYTLAEAETRMNAAYLRMKTIPAQNWGQEMTSFHMFKQQSLRKIHSLWRTFVVAPRLPVNTPAIRAVKDPSYLPHNLAGIDDSKLVSGMAFLDNAFVSTALVSPQAYFNGPLSAFFNNSTTCCMMSLTIAAGTPAIPLFIKKQQLSYYPTEEEIVLPPLCQYVFRQKKTFPLSAFGKPLEVYHFDVYPAFSHVTNAGSSS